MKLFPAVLLFALWGCASAIRDDSMHATVIARREVLQGAEDPRHFITIEYTDATGATVHDEISVSDVDYRRFGHELYVCVHRSLDGYSLTSCPD